MKKAFRIRKNEEFSEIINKKHYYANASFIIYTNLRKEEHSRVGISVSKKLGDAVLRNRIKRQVRMMFLNIYDFKDSEYDLICIIKANYKNNNFATNQNELEKLVKKAIINK